ncbi:LHFPL tetraspan subfamily member 3 protein-like isoform X1 [Ostrea edulis]|uniref:LHFPL tetraspan subfamily member 3 protein-like isoform X1 n=1 Tax=Ostrea edulis TaxID=37623 RepID=UPI0024AEA703|nr:LHFPL tetraspan subfamily member 3 protein-like isoform X1 [Ostrea edulis]
MDREAEHLPEYKRMQHLTYRRNIRVITVVWGIFSACFVILNAVAFIQPQWLGDTETSPGVGFFGLYEYCERLQVGGEYSCRGDFLDFTTLTNDSFRAASMLVGVCALVFMFSVVCLLLFCFLKAVTVLKICGVLQTIGCVCMALGCIIYPNGWDDEKVQRTCGKDAGKYRVGQCQVRWAFILSIVLVFDALILATLAFILAAKQANLLQKSEYRKRKSTYTNGGFTDITPAGEKVAIQETVIADDSSQAADDIRL